MLATALDIEVDWTNSAAYLHNWLKVLKGDPEMIIKASKQAQKIVDHVLPVFKEQLQAA
jgi:antirestriction protein ArdC